MITVLGSKIATMFLTGAVSILLGLLPLKLKGCIRTDSVRHQTIISGLLCLGGGVLLAIAMIHVLPEVRENLEHALGGTAHETPYAEIIFCAGFFLSYFIEEFVHFACDSGLRHNERNCGEFHDSESVLVHKAFSQNTLACEVAGQQLDCNLDNRRTSEPAPSAGKNSNEDKGVRSPVTKRTTASFGNATYNTFHNQGSDSEGSSSDEQYNGSRVAPTQSKTSLVKNILTIMALSTHAVFEGLIIGLEESATAVWTLFAGFMNISAVALHKYVISFCVGVELFSQATNSLKMNICYIITYAIMSPVGIAIGIAMTSATLTSSFYLAIGIIQGLASGTLMYVIVFEVFQREKAKEEILGIVQLAFVIVGFVAMLMVELNCKC